MKCPTGRCHTWGLRGVFSSTLKLFPAHTPELFLLYLLYFLNLLDFLTSHLVPACGDANTNATTTSDPTAFPL